MRSELKVAPFFYQFPKPRFANRQTPTAAVLTLPLIEMLSRNGNWTFGMRPIGRTAEQRATATRLRRRVSQGRFAMADNKPSEHANGKRLNDGMILIGIAIGLFLIVN